MKYFKNVLSAILLITAISLSACSNASGGGGAETSYIGTKAPTAAKTVGDIVFTDGSAMAYTDFATLDAATKETKKASAIALIFYKGTGLNSDVNGVANTTTSRTLGVGLKHNRSGLAWCTNSANAFYTKITTIQCPASGNLGAFTFTDDKNGSDNLKQIGDFLTNNDTNTSEAATKYPAFYFGKNYATNTVTNIAAGSEFAAGWYLPSLAELYQIYTNGKGTNKVFDIDAASQALGGDAFGTSYYWSSSQYASPAERAYGLSFNSGDWIYNNKDIYDLRYVCCIRAFN
jgi:hypothetical protein